MQFRCVTNATAFQRSPATDLQTGPPALQGPVFKWFFLVVVRRPFAVAFTPPPPNERKLRHGSQFLAASFAQI